MESSEDEDTDHHCELIENVKRHQREFYQPNGIINFLDNRAEENPDLNVVKKSESAAFNLERAIVFIVSRIEKNETEELTQCWGEFTLSKFGVSFTIDYSDSKFLENYIEKTKSLTDYIILTYYMCNSHNRYKFYDYSIAHKKKIASMLEKLYKKQVRGTRRLFKRWLKELDTPQSLTSVSNTSVENEEGNESEDGIDENSTLDTSVSSSDDFQ